MLRGRRQKLDSHAALNQFHKATSAWRANKCVGLISASFLHWSGTCQTVRMEDLYVHLSAIWTLWKGTQLRRKHCILFFYLCKRWKWNVLYKILDVIQKNWHWFLPFDDLLLTCTVNMSHWFRYKAVKSGHLVFKKTELEVSIVTIQFKESK